MKILKVLIEHRTLSLEPSFSYLANDNTLVNKGYRVLVPFGKQKIIGLVLEVNETFLTVEQLSSRDGFQYKFIEKVIDEKPILDDDLLQLAYQMADRYVTPLIQCIQTILPTAYKPQIKSIQQSIKGRMVKRIIPIFGLDSSILTPKQAQIYQELCASPISYLKDYKNKAIIKKLQEMNYIQIQDEEIKNDYLKAYTNSNFQKSVLNKEQQTAFLQIINSEKKTILLQGVTGSGKTEVYLHLVDYYVKKKQTAIVLVPEIALTPMIIERFQSWFSNIAVLHGNLTPLEKKVQYDKIKNKEVKVVIGARSAIFAPLTDIGIIILDEEQSTSYKQENMPTYHARDIAILRAKQWNSKVILGSATPSFETKARAIKGVYESVFLTKRANHHPLPICQIVNMREENVEGVPLISKTLDTEIKKRLANHEKIILLQNRRGYSPYVSCRSCGYLFKCPNCEVSMSYHKKGNKLKCHYCNYEIEFEKDCPKCHGTDFLFMGSGTQKIEEVLSKEYPQAKLLRMDNDTTTIKHGHLKILKQFQEQDYQILLGTQMVAKGLDFPDVTLVGVIDSDITLAVADFRSNEFTFELLSQVAGRAGRGDKEGKVIIQTYNPEHYAIQYAAKHDYQSFFNHDMAFRNRRNYPPFSYLSSLTLLCEKPENALLIADKIADFLTSHTNFEILGPSFPYIYKEHSKYRVRLIIKSKNQSLMTKTLHEIVDQFKKECNSKKCSLVLDIDTYKLL